MMNTGPLCFLTDIYGVKQFWIMALLCAVVKQFSWNFCPINAHNFIWQENLKASLKQSYKLPERPMQYFPSLSTPQNSFLQLLKCWKENNFLCWHLNGIVPCEKSYWDICWKSTKIIWTYFELILSDSSTFNLVWKTAMVENRC